MYLLPVEEMHVYLVHTDRQSKQHVSDSHLPLLNEVFMIPQKWTHEDEEHRCSLEEPAGSDENLFSVKCVKLESER